MIKSLGEFVNREQLEWKKKTHITIDSTSLDSNLTFHLPSIETLFSYLQKIYELE